jgi:hypothetical protein
MKILFIHQNFPGQFQYLAPALANKGHEVHAFKLTTQVSPIQNIRKRLLNTTFQSYLN